MIDGQWHATVSKWRDEKSKIHFIPRGRVRAVCGRGGPRYTRSETLSGPVDPAGRVRCQKCLDCIEAEKRYRRRTKAIFMRLLDRMEQKDPAAHQQICSAWPAHAQEDDTAEWWDTTAPAIILEMIDFTKGRGV